MEPWEIENLRRSVVMLAPGHSVGVMSREQALELFGELNRLDQTTNRYREVVAQLRHILDSLDGG